MNPLLRLLAMVALVAAGCLAAGGPVDLPPSGSLIRLDEAGRPAELCPLKHTQVLAEISGFFARVTLTQHFENPHSEPIEAVYTFPLPQRSAVDRMTVTVGDRIVRGVIKRREEARTPYEEARRGGRLAGLLDQERPNIFTQAVANIPPGEKVKVTISYLETLRYESGRYEFVFPMVVGPRYIPGRLAGRTGGGWAPDTDQVPDASRITPRAAAPGTRAGHDISLKVALDAGFPLEALECPSHETEIERPDPSRARVRLRQKAVIPNKDFVLRYDIAGRRTSDALLVHRGERGGFLALILQPPERAAVEETIPKEIVFVLDTSGSMSGFPIEKAKEVIGLALDGLNPHDAFNLITFSGDTHVLFPEPVPATQANIERARAFLASRRGAGGTEMLRAIRTALAPTDSKRHVRVVCFLTDGYVGNDLEILAEVKRHPEARIFAFGIGSAVNRFLLDKMAELGRGEVEYVGLNEDGSAAARRFWERVRNPLVTDLTVDWNGLPVDQVTPQRIPDLFAARAVAIFGRYSGPAKGVIRLRGRAAGRAFLREVPVELPAAAPGHELLATLWARERVEDLLAEDFSGWQMGGVRADVRDAVTKLGLEHALVTPFTSLVAVEEITVTSGGEPRRIEVPVEMAERVSYEGVFGEAHPAAAMMALRSPAVFSTFATVGTPAPAQTAAGIVLRGAAPGGRQTVRRSEVATSESRRLAPELGEILARLKKGQPIGPAPFLRGGLLELRVWVTDVSPQTLARLRQAGLEILARAGTANLVLGRIRAEHLGRLAALEVVRYVAPAS